ncbi:MAG: hypothetical protein ACLUR5_06240 [Eubacterium ventriosum]
MDDITSSAPYYPTIRVAIIMGINIVFVFLCSNAAYVSLFLNLCRKNSINHMQIVEKWGIYYNACG